MSTSHSITPQPLQKGDTIGVMAPSTAVNKENIEKAAEMLRQQGYNVEIHPQCFERNKSSAGTAASKASAFHELVSNTNIHMILTAGGGNHSGMMLEHLDYNLIRANPKIICGYSDVTALLCAIYKHTGLITYHGPTLSHIAREKYTQEQLLQCLSLLSAADSTIDISKGSNVLYSGDSTTAPLLGGNLSLISSLIGTAYAPDFKGSILFLEDCGDQLSRYARMLTHIHNAGIFHELNGLIIGDMSSEPDTGSIPFGFSIAEIITDFTADYNYPVVVNAPFGHGADLPTFPHGQQVKLHAAPSDVKIEL